MVGKKSSLLCNCLGAKSKRNKGNIDQNDVYETPQAVNTLKKAPIVRFNSTQDDSDSNKPSTSLSTITATTNNPTNKHHLFGWSWRKQKNHKLPQVSPKSVTFSQEHDIPHIDDPVPTYETIDADVSSDTYSKVEDRQKPYDYPMFPNHMINRRRQLEENLYASASQTYSVGSEDPYSSISSMCGTNRPPNDDISVGYARVNEDQLRSGRQRFPNVDDLYAKVNRKSVIERRVQNGLLASASHGTIRNMQQIQPSTSTTFMTESDDGIYQLEESGSGSVVSSGSCNPSYRYLTVRETLGAIRERIRRRNEEGNYSTAKEHYYSTISNDYESVRNDLNFPSTSAQNRSSNFSSGRNGLLTNELKINTMSNGQSSQFRPPPAPTSPIPQLPTTSKSHSSTFPDGSADGDAAVSSIETSLSSPSINPLLFRATNKMTPRIIWPQDQANEIRIVCSKATTNRPIVISMANILLRKHESTPNIKYMKSIATSTNDLTELPKPKKSKIPRPVSKNQVYIESNNSVAKKPPTRTLTLKRSPKRSPLGFLSVGNDYVSPIDFTKPDKRGWPFNRTL